MNRTSFIASDIIREIGVIWPYQKILVIYDNSGDNDSDDGDNSDDCDDVDGGDNSDDGEDGEGWQHQSTKAPSSALLTVRLKHFGRGWGWWW